MIKRKVNLVLGIVLLLAIVILVVHTGYISGAAVSTTSACMPITLTAGQGKILFGKPVYLTSVVSAGTINLKVNDVTAIVNVDELVSVEGLTIEVVDTRFTPNVQNRVANIIVCENA